MKRKMILGIGGFEHNSAAALMCDGKIVCAIEEERLNRIKNYAGFPFKAIEFCLHHAGISEEDITNIAVGEDLYARFLKRSEYWNIQKENGNGFAEKIIIRENHAVQDAVSNIHKLINVIGQPVKLHLINHHAAHAAGVFSIYDVKDAVFLSADYMGEWETIAIGNISHDRLNVYSSQVFPHSLGMLYSAVTQFLGFEILSDEYKVMGLASYGVPSYIEQMRLFLEFNQYGLPLLNQKYFDIGKSFVMAPFVSQEFIKIFGMPRLPQEKLTEKHLNIASSLQYLMTETIIHMVQYIRETCDSDNLCYTGELALNCGINTAIAEEKLFKNIYIQPASHDAGTAVGACYYVDRISQKIPVEERIGELSCT